MAGTNALQQVEETFPEVGTTGVEEVVIGGKGDTDVMDQLDEMFADLEAGLPKENVVVSGLPPEAPVTETQMLEAGHAVSTDELKAKALEELDEQSTPAPDNSQTPAPVLKKAAPVTKRISTVGMAKSEALANALGDRLGDLLTIDSTALALPADVQFDQRIALLDRIDKMPKKIGEKATNLFAHVAKGAALSNYTRIAINFLVQNDEMSSKQLKDTYLSRPYSEGTSSSQCTQLMHLLPALGIAIKSGGRLIPNPNSTLLPLLTALVQPGPTTGPVEEPEDSEEA
jgi:hypothetical protein